MRRRSVSALLLFLLAAALYPQAIDKPAATVRLTRSEAVTVKQLRKQVEIYEDQLKRSLTLDERKQVLDGLINMKLIEQSAERDKVSVSDVELKTQLTSQKKNLAAQLGLNRELTDAELQQAVLSSVGMSWDEYLKQLKYSLLLQKYVGQKKRSLFENVKLPTDEEIQGYYDNNQRAFITPEMVRLKHILIDTRNLTAKEEKDKAQARADDIYRELKNGASFDDLVVKYSEDTASKYKGGDFGYLVREDAQTKQFIGKDFFDAAFKLKVGEMSGVLQSNIGFHIIKVVEKIPVKILGIDDKIPPLYQITVRQKIRDDLSLVKQSEVLTKAAQELVIDLRKQAEIKVFEENISW